MDDSDVGSMPVMRLSTGVSYDILEGDLAKAYYRISLPKIGPAYREFVETVYKHPMNEKLAYWERCLHGVQQ